VTPVSGRVPPRPPPLSPSFLLIGLARRVREEVETALHAQGLTLRHLSALGHLAGEPGLSYSELGRRAGVSAQSMQATVGHLEARGAVERRTDAGRGRTARLHVTDTGTRLLGEGQNALAAADQRLHAAIPAEHHAGFTAALFAAWKDARDTP